MGYSWMLIGVSVCSAAIASAQPAVRPTLDETLRSIRTAYSLAQPYEVKCRIFAPAPPGQQEPGEDAEPLQYKRVRAAPDGSVLCDDTHPVQMAAIGMQSGTIYRGDSWVRFSKGNEGVRQEVGPELAKSMPILYAPSALGFAVSSWASLDAASEVVDDKPGFVAVRCPTSGYTFHVDTSDWTVTSWTEETKGLRVEATFEEFQPRGPFKARFPRRLRTTATSSKEPAAPFSTLVIFGQPTAITLATHEMEWWTYSPTATDLEHTRRYGPGDKLLADDIQPIEQMNPRPGVDAMIVTGGAGKPRLPVQDNRLRNWLLGVGVACVVVAIAVAIRRRLA